MNGLLIIILFLLRIKISCEKIENYINLYILTTMATRKTTGLTEDEDKFVGQVGTVLGNARYFIKSPAHSTLRGLYIPHSGIFTDSLFHTMGNLVSIMREDRHMSSNAQTKALAVLPDLQRIRLQILLIQHPAFTKVEHSKDGKPIGSMSSGILAQLDDVIGVARKSLSS